LYDIGSGNGYRKCKGSEKGESNGIFTKASPNITSVEDGGLFAKAGFFQGFIGADEERV
jgi:hypothetical protein